MQESRKQPSDEMVAQLSKAWLTAYAAAEAPPEWVENQQLDWMRFGYFDALWRFVVQLCEDVSADDDEAIRQIAVDPLWNLIQEWPDAALAAIDAEADVHRKLIRALASVVAPTDLAQQQIAEIVDRHGRNG